MTSKLNVQFLIINCGSSSLKYRIIKMPEELELASGEAQRVGLKTDKQAVIIHNQYDEKSIRIETDMPSHDIAFEKILQLLETKNKKNSKIYFDAFAHRYVHPGNLYKKNIIVREQDIELLSKTMSYAPIHNPTSFKLIQLCHTNYKQIPQYIVFDTTFHKTIPNNQKIYGIPEKWTKKYDLKKVGFHGISHQYVMETTCNYLKKPKNTLKMISCHLGTGGASICAIDKGVSVNSSMGFTPLEGLIMNTRCGDIDLGAVLYLMFHHAISTEEMEKILNKQSGVLSVFESSSDLRDAIQKYSNTKKAKEIVDMYVRRIKKYIGYYMLQLQKTDVLIFTDTLGVEEPFIRKLVCNNMDVFNIDIDNVKNDENKEGILDISAKNSQSKILVIPTNEEVLMAREAWRIASKCK